MSTCKEVLRSLPSKLKPTLKSRITEILDEINDLRTRGYKYLEITQILGEQGIAIKCSTLKKYVQQLNRAARTTKPGVLPLPKARR